MGRIDRYSVISVFAIDPGGTTGWCLVPDARLDQVPHSDAQLEIIATQVGGDEHQQVVDLYRLINVARKNYGNVAVVIEDFVPRVLNQQRWFLSPVRITAGLTQLLWQDRIRWGTQSASLAKTTITDDHLRQCNQWLPGKPHANDAIRHGLTYIRRVRQVPELHEELTDPRDLD